MHIEIHYLLISEVSGCRTARGTEEASNGGGKKERLPPNASAGPVDPVSALVSTNASEF